MSKFDKEKTEFKARHRQWGRVFARLAGVAAAGLTATAGMAETVYLCWQGAGGYTMTGRMVYADDLAGSYIVTEADVTEFEIIGYFEGDFIGSWDLSRLEDDTSWKLRYDVRTRVFPLKGDTGLYQMWNANGAVNDCGNPGFGFNAGNGGQDVCIDNTFIVSSTIDWDTPLVALGEAPAPDCSGTVLLGKQEGTL